MSGLGTFAIAALTVVGGIITANITANSVTKDKIAEVNLATAVVSQRVTSNEQVATDRLNRLEDKIDWLVKQQGGVPNLISK